MAGIRAVEPGFADPKLGGVAAGSRPEGRPALVRLRATVTRRHECVGGERGSRNQSQERYADAPPLSLPRPSLADQRLEVVG